MPAGAVLLVDEFHEIFFNQKAGIANGKIISGVFKLMEAERIIGLSATFRGEAGIKNITNTMKAKFL